MEYQYSPGSLVTARGRDWVVLPYQEPEVLRLRPLTGGDGNEIGIFLPLEGGSIRPATFSPPEPQPGDATGSLLLFDAARLSLRSGATPFRSLGRLSVVPRPYQFVPLIMALRLDPVRLLIADDVGVGKTIEAAMIARELLDRGIAKRLGVICPAHLCDQWETELREKFLIEPIVIQPSRIARLERDLPRADLSIYQYYPHLVASIDFIKSERHRDHFIQNAPDLIIVDEAHMASRPRGDFKGLQQQRYAFLRSLAADPRRHLLLVTATPHSGIEESFHSLLGLINPDFDINEQRPSQELDRKNLQPHIVQRRRRDLERWLGTETPFPERESREIKYSLSNPYLSLFNDVLTYCRESVESARGLRAQQQRVRHWAAIALLRCVLSSPAAAEAVLSGLAQRRGFTEEVLFDSEEEVDQAYRPQVLDASAEEESPDYTPSAPLEDAGAHLTDSERKRLGAFLKRARSLAGPGDDQKLAAVVRTLNEFLAEGYRPIVFCRFIATANYLKIWLSQLLPVNHPGVRVIAVSGEIGDEERRAKVAELTQSPVRVLVATDCLSEGINLQEHFDAVVHYDLPWNPNRLEQREGRVDRFNQRRDKVKVDLIYGADNQVDLVVLDVLIRKARAIRNRLGISVPVPAQAEQVVQAVVDTVFLRTPSRGVQLQMEFETPEVSKLHAEWEERADREGKQRAYFAQHSVKPEEVAKELEATDPVLGDPQATERFLRNVAQRFNGELRPLSKPGVFHLIPGDLQNRLTALGDYGFPLRVTFDRFKDETAVYLGRTHPIIETYCHGALGRAFAPAPDELFARTGAMFTDAVQIRTAILLLRFRYLLREQVEEFAEEIVLAAFQRQEGRLTWLEPLDEVARHLIETARPVANMPLADRTAHVSWALEMLQGDDWFKPLVHQRTGELQESHQRLRKLVKAPKLTIKPHTPPDILGCYVLVPAGGKS